MTEERNTPSELCELLTLLLENTISKEQFADLEDRLVNDADARKYYIEFLSVYVGLHHRGGISTPAGTPSPATPSSKPIAQQLLREAIENEERLATERADHEAQYIVEEEAVVQARREEEIKNIAEAKFQEFLKKEQERLAGFHNQRYVADRGWRYFSFGVLAASLIIVVLVLYFNRKSNIPAVPQVVATLTETLGTEWDDRTLPTIRGSELYAGEMRLLKGYAQITFTDGAQVVLQAPARFKLETSEQMFLQSGRLAAKVPFGAEGFKVNTPSAMMIDLGTEFGVIVSEAGQSELHVFQGEVKLFSQKRSGRNIYKQTIQTGQAGVVDKNGRLSEVLRKASPRRFVRGIPQEPAYGRPGERLDLSDVVGGGSGFGTGELNQSINPDDGRIRAGFYNRGGTAVSGSSDFVPTADLNFIDGVFIPDGDGSVVVSSQGHTFDGCPDTSGVFCWDVFNGNVTIEGRCRQILDGREYGTYSQPAISMHSNSGITFDLEKIRNSLPGSQIIAFSTLCGLADARGDPGADFWVLVDGHERFSITGARWQDRARSVRINLSDHDRFLTIIITDGGNLQRSGGHDWGIFAKPVLILAPENLVSR